MVEYNLGLPAALVEYKHYYAQEPNVGHPTYRALRNLADNYMDGRGEQGLPFLIAFYWPEVWAFRVRPINALAQQWFERNEVLTERDYVSRLYEIRKFVIDENVYRNLNDLLPSETESEVRGLPW